MNTMYGIFWQSKVWTLVHPSIFITVSGVSRGSSSVSRDAQASLSTHTSSSSRRSQVKERHIFSSMSFPGPGTAQWGVLKASEQMPDPSQLLLTKYSHLRESAFIGGDWMRSKHAWLIVGLCDIMKNDWYCDILLFFFLQEVTTV